MMKVVARLLLAGSACLAAEAVARLRAGDPQPPVAAPVALGGAARQSHAAAVSANLALAAQWMALDLPHYRECGRTMNHAWRAAADSPCSVAARQAADEMRAMVPVCSELRQGQAYLRSYRALRMEDDTWCGFPGCVPPCAEDVECKRSHAFPFDTECRGPLMNQTAAAAGYSEAGESNVARVLRKMGAARLPRRTRRSAARRRSGAPQPRRGRSAASR